MSYTTGRGRIRRRKLNARRRRHRNPSMRSLLSVRGLMHTLTPAVGGAAGALALDVALSYVPADKLPTWAQGPWAKVGIKVLGAVALGALAGKFVNRRTGMLVTSGALTVTAYGVIKDFVAKNVPSIPVSGIDPPMGSDYSDTRLAYVSPSPMLQNGMGAYMRNGTSPQRVGAYMRDSLDTVNVHGINDGM